MKAVMPVLAAVLLSLFTVHSAANAPQGGDAWNAAEIAWKDMGTGVREATTTGKPVLMLFQATWCTACRKYQAVFKDDSVVKASRDLVMILIDIDKNPEINSGFSPDGVYVPRTIFLDAMGDVRQDLKGADPKYPHSLDNSGPAELLSLMKKAAGQPAVPDPSERADNAN